MPETLLVAFVWEMDPPKRTAKKTKNLAVTLLVASVWEMDPLKRTAKKARNLAVPILLVTSVWLVLLKKMLWTSQLSLPSYLLVSPLLELVLTNGTDMPAKAKQTPGLPHGVVILTPVTPTSWVLVRSINWMASTIVSPTL